MEKVKRQSCTKNARNAVWMRMAAHSLLTAIKFFGGARARVAMAAVSAGSWEEQEDSEGSYDAVWPTFESFVKVKLSEADLHSLHFFLVFSAGTEFSCEHKHRQATERSS